MKKIVFLRHGQSEWNLSNQFTGWVDVDLSEKGTGEAVKAGQLLKEQGYHFDIAYTSVLKRAIRTLWICLEQIDQCWLPTEKTWLLNERHYGALQGLNKAQTAEKFGADQVQQWRRGYAIRPPELEADNDQHPNKDDRYRKIKNLPGCESLKDTLDRVVPYWESTIKKQLQLGLNPIVTAHGNSLRALIKHIDSISDDQITSLNIPTGVPLVYEFDDKLNPIRHYYLGDRDEIEAQAAQVRDQIKQ